MANLFTDFHIKDKRINNRIVMPPMVCFGWADESGLVTSEHLEHYEKRAKAGIGLIIVEATCVSKTGRLADSQLGLWSDEHITGLSKLVDICHKYNTAVLIQIHHAGLKTPESVSKAAIAPSDYSDGKVIAREMTISEIKEIQRDFVQAAVRAQKAGFDGIELHGAHGYLINQFNSPVTNRRSDEYGGILANRMRFVCEIINEIRRETGEDFIIGYRMGGNEPTLEEGVEIARMLEERGIDVLHVSAGISSGVTPVVPQDFNYNWIVYMGTEIKKNVSVPVIVVNGIRTPQQAEYLIENELSDFVAIGKGLLVDSKWPEKALSKEDAKPCLQCKRCSWFNNGRLCPQNKQTN